MEAQVECDDHTELLREYEQAINQLEVKIIW